MWCELLILSMAAAMTFGSPANSSDLLHNHAPDPGPAPVYTGSRTQEALYHDYLTQIARTRKDKETISGSTSLPKFEGNYGVSDISIAPSTVNIKRKSKKRPTTPGPVLYDYGYPDDVETAQGKNIYTTSGKQKNSFRDNKEVSGTHGYYATPGSSTNRDRRPYESSYYEPIDYDDGYYQAEASGIQQQTAEQPPEGAGSGPSSKVRPSHAGHRGKIVNSAHEIDQIKASASEYYGGYGNGYGGGYDDFHHAYGGGSYHQVPYRPSHHRSSKGPLALLLGLLPLGLLFASLMPSFYNVPFAAIPPAGIAVQNIAAPPVAGRRRRDIHVDDAPKNNDVKPRSLTAMSSLQTTLTSVIESNPVIKVLQEYRLHGLNSPSCIQRLTCEILLTQPWMQTFAKSYDSSWAKPLGLNPLVKAVVTGKCKKLNCTNNNESFATLSVVNQNSNVNFKMNSKNSIDANSVL